MTEAAGLRTSPCRGCGKPILWGKTPEGKSVPLDPRPPCYYVRDDGSGYWADRAGREPMPVYVSHFATCPAANEFSGKSKASASRIAASSRTSSSSSPSSDPK